MKRYNNYHKHTHYSSIFTPDSNAHISDYIDRCKELGEINFWTTEHGSMGSIFEAVSLCEQNNIHCKPALEGYIVPNPLEKDNSNYHIMLIPRTNDARKKLNKASSRANIEGYYYKPRLFLDDLLNFEPNELYITTACCAGIISTEEAYNDIFVPLVNRFEDSVFLEVQNHNVDVQKEINSRAIWLSNKFGLRLICANDSHYIYPEQYSERLELLKGKGINYGNEDSFLLDYPSYDIMVERFQKQGVLTDTQIDNAMEATLILDNCEDIFISKEIKMPTIYPNQTDEEKIQILKKYVNEGYQKVIQQDNIPIEQRHKYIEECRKEMQVIEDTKEIHTADYFLLNIKMLNLAINKYGGVLTRTGRGSCGAFLLNKMLGITQIDRLDVDLPIYSERFMSTERLLENRALPDIDYNVVSQEPFVSASRELLGEKGCYPMLAYGTMKQSEAFRNICRSAELPYDEYNDVAKNIELYENDNKWKPYIDESKKYIDTIISCSVHPCAHILLNGDIESEIGVVKIGDELCAMMTSDEADEYKYLKNDYLIVTVWDIISQTFDMIGEPIYTIKELTQKLDDKTWKLFEQGLTCTLNQVDSDYATALIKQYKPHKIEDLAKFVGAIRPNFNEFRDGFMSRQIVTTGSKELDNLLTNTEHMVIFQENLMQFFEWLGIKPSESIGLIKKISKKKIKESDFEKITDRLKNGWKKNVGNIEGFVEIWEKMQSMMKYSFNSPHGLAYAYDCLYCAYLKAHYPLEYFTVTLNLYSADEARTIRLTDEMKNWDIKIKPPKFGNASNNYICDKETNTIYKGLRSIKDFQTIGAEILQEISDRNPQTFLDVLQLIEEIKIDGKKLNKKSLEILIKIGFFEKFGTMQELIATTHWFNEFGKKKTIKKDKVEDWLSDIVSRHCEKETEKQFSKVDGVGIVADIIAQLPHKDEDTFALIKNQVKHLGYADVDNLNISPNIYILQKYEKDSWGRTWVTIYQILSGESATYKLDKTFAKTHKPVVNDIIKCAFGSEPVYKKMDGNWQKTPDVRPIVKFFSYIEKNT